MSRPTWAETWAEVAQAVALRSLCTRAQVGAVIVNAENRIVATGYNGPPAGFTHVHQPCIAWCDRAKCAAENRSPSLHPMYDDCPALHAEANALMAADRSSWQGGTIYVTGAVCMSCAKLIANSGLHMVVTVAEATDRTYRRPAEVDQFLRACGITVGVVG